MSPGGGWTTTSPSIRGRARRIASRLIFFSSHEPYNAAMRTKSEAVQRFLWLDHGIHPLTIETPTTAGGRRGDDDKGCEIRLGRARIRGASLIETAGGRCRAPRGPATRPRQSRSGSPTEPPRLPSRGGEEHHPHVTIGLKGAEVGGTESRASQQAERRGEERTENGRGREEHRNRAREINISARKIGFE